MIPLYASYAPHERRRTACAKFTGRLPTSMAFGLVFLDHGGEVWTVDVRLPGGQPGGRSLVFSRPSFLAPTEQRALDDVPPRWPDRGHACSRPAVEALRQDSAW